MKKQLTIIIISALLILCSYISKAQEYEYVPFPDSGAIWSEIYFPPVLGEEEPSLERFALSGEDTIINSLSYKKLYLFYDTVFNINTATYFGGIREDSMKRVYFKSDTTLHDFKPDNYHHREIILYDFWLNIGDTIGYLIDSLDYNWGWSMNLIVQEIDTIQIGNSLRKLYHFENYTWVKWIEGIGNNRGLLFTSGDLPFNGIYGDLICFKQNDEILYFNDNYNECMPLISGIPINKNESFQIKVFPNPSAQNINISFPSNETGRISIYKADGEKIFETYINYTKELEINLTGINKGLYLLVFKNVDNNIFSSKLIIN